MTNMHYSAFLFIVLILLLSPVSGQAPPYAERSSNEKPILWRSVDISAQDLFYGPGGKKMLPNVKKIEFIKEEKGGSSKKYRIRDGSGITWVAKIDKEAQPETASVRLLFALGYVTEINYLVPELTIPGKGTFKNVRLEARPKHVERKGRWKWTENPFIGTNELQGLKIMMALMNNWDLKDGNTIILETRDERHYVISDLGAAFGKTGSNGLPLFWRIGRSVNRPKDFSESKFIDGVKGDRIDFAFKGKHDHIFDNITLENGRWLSKLLSRLSDKQISDAFRAANYSAEDNKILTRAIRERTNALDRVSAKRELAQIKR